jgi:hypothetical protein
MTNMFAKDYSEEPIGCCLNCEKAEPGCLCYECCCTKCSHYISPGDWDGVKGKCDLCLRREFTPEEKKTWAKKKAIEESKNIKLPDDSRKITIKPTKYTAPWGEGWVDG